MGALIINNNAQALNTMRNLQKVDRQMQTTLEHLSSGMKINRAADGPATLMISEQMRSQIGSIKQAINNAQTSVSMVQTTESALDEVNRLLVSMRQLTIHAANEGANDERMLAADQFEIANAIEALDQISKYTQFGTKKILDGSNGVNCLAAGAGLTFLKATPETKSSPIVGYEVMVDQAASKASLTTTRALTQDVIDRGTTLTVQESGRVATYVTKPGEDPSAVVRNLQNAIDGVGLEVNVGLDMVQGGGEGQPAGEVLTVTHREFGKDPSFAVVSDFAGVLSAVDGVPLEVNNANDITGTINGQLTYGKGRVLTAAPGTEADGLQVLFEGEVMPPQPGQENSPVGRVKVTQNSLVFQIGPQAGQRVKVALNGVSSKTLGHNVDTPTGYSNLSEIDVRSHQGATDALALIDAAIDDVTSVRGDLGAIQKNALESNIRSLRVAQEEMVNAESIIRDADMAEEMSNLTRNQIILQSATSMLGQANQVPRNILSLLQNA